MACLPIKRYIKAERHLGSGVGSEHGFIVEPTWGSNVRLESTDYIAFRCPVKTAAVPSWVREKVVLQSTEDLFMRDVLVVGRERYQRLLLMVVEWKDGIAYRIGTAEMNEEVWIELQRIWQLVTLG